MSEITELCNELEELQKKIKEEPRKRRMRNAQIEYEIRELENDRTRYGNKLDFHSVEKINLQINELKREKNVGKSNILKEDLKINQKLITDEIVNYYKNGHTIDDIIEVEEIPQNILDEWFEFGDFGKESGYLFVGYIFEEDNNWSYSNPINKVKFNSKTLDELKAKINENNEILLIFNQELADESEKRDLIIYQNIIDEKIDYLKDSEYDGKSDILYDLKEFADKFNKSQINCLCDLFISDYYMSIYLNDFDYIFKVNNDKISSDFYKNVIDICIDKLNDMDLVYSKKDYLFNNLKNYADKFSEIQFTKFCNLFISKYYVNDYLDEFDYIFNINSDKIRNDFYSKLIDDRITKLNNSDSYYRYEMDAFNDLNKFADKFVENQFRSFCDLFVSKYHVHSYWNKFNHIRNVNMDKFDDNVNEIIDYRLDNLDYSNIWDLKKLANDFSEKQIKYLCDMMISNHNTYEYFDDLMEILNVNMDKFGIDYDELYNNIIEARLELLTSSDLDNECISDIFDNLEYCSTYFTDDQLEKLSNLMVNKDKLHDYFTVFNKILTENNYSFDYMKFIDSRLQILRNIDSDYNVGTIVHSLKDIVIYITEKQLNQLIHIILDNNGLYNFSSDFKYIIEHNLDKLDNIDNIFSNVIDSRIDKLETIKSYSNISYIFLDLELFSDVFKEIQIDKLCDIIIDKELISYLSSTKILSANINKFNNEIDNKIYGLIIDYKLNELNKLSFGYTTAKHILGDLKDYSHLFSQVQINKLCDIAIYNSQVYNCYICTDNLKFILEINKDKIAPEVYEKVCIKNNID